MSFVKFPSIDKFSDVYKWAQRTGVGEVEYGFKIKLHGTNAAIRVEGDKLTAQKRTSDVTVDADNCGFAAWVQTLSHAWISEPKIIYGEWAGPGVQKTDAVTQIPEKHFFIFSVYYPETDKWVTEPSSLSYHARELKGSDRIKVIPWFGFATVDFRYQANCQTFIDDVMANVDNIGKVDTYILKEFGIEGPGEGLVGYPLTDGIGGKFMFKAKTEVHSVNKAKKRNHVAPEKPEGVEEFLDMFLTDARFNQMLTEIGGEADRKKTGEFMKAVMTDVHKESVNELEASGLEWNKVAKYAPQRIKEWWFKQCSKL